MRRPPCAPVVPVFVVATTWGGFFLLCWLVYAASGHRCITVHEVSYFSYVFLLFNLGSDARRLPVASLLHNGTAPTTK